MIYDWKYFLHIGCSLRMCFTRRELAVTIGARCQLLSSPTLLLPFASLFSSRAHNSTHRYLLRRGLPIGPMMFPLEPMPPSLIRAVLLRSRGFCVPRLLGIVGVCVRRTIRRSGLGRGEHPSFPIGPAMAASLLISAVARAATVISLPLYVSWHIVQNGGCSCPKRCALYDTARSECRVRRASCKINSRSATLWLYRRSH